LQTFQAKCGVYKLHTVI